MFYKKERQVSAFSEFYQSPRLMNWSFCVFGFPVTSVFRFALLPTVFCLQSQLFVFNGWGKNGFYSGRISECHLTECLATMKTIHETSQKKSWFQKIWRNVFWQILIDMWEIRCLYRYLFKFPADFVPFTEEILHGKLHFLCSVSNLF